MSSCIQFTNIRKHFKHDCISIAAEVDLLSSLHQGSSSSLHSDLAIALVEFSPDKHYLAVVCQYVVQLLQQEKCSKLKQEFNMAFFILLFDMCCTSLNINLIERTASINSLYIYILFKKIAVQLVNSSYNIKRLSIFLFFC